MADSTLWGIGLAVAVIVALSGLAWLVTRHRTNAAGPAGRHRPERATFRDEAQEKPKKILAVVINPTKVDDLASTQDRIRSVALAHDWAEPIFAETTLEDPGQGQTRAAVEAGANVVCALGGDGTVRTIAEALVGTNVPLGLLPGGTGNLLARNLEMPLANLERAVRDALTGRNHHLDIATMTLDPDGTGERRTEHTFLVMAGMGMDAQIMAGAPEDLKAKVGWPAYVVSGVKNLRGERFKMTLSVDGGEPIAVKARTVMFGNCGMLPGGISLLPDAEPDDGILDCVVLSPQTLAGWVAVAGKLARRTTSANRRVDHYTGQTFEIRAERPEPIQIDGDVFEPARVVTATITPRGLIVRTPL